MTFSGRLRRKDADYGARLAAALGVDVPFGRVALTRLDELLARGMGELDESGIIEVARGVVSPAVSMNVYPRVDGEDLS